MSKEKDKTCNICKQDIVKGEEYCILSQFTSDWKLFKESDYHVRCYRERFLNKAKLDEDSKYFMHRAFNLLSKMEKEA